MREKVVSGSKIPQRVCYERVSNVTIVLRLHKEIADDEQTPNVALLTLLRISWQDHTTELHQLRGSSMHVKVLLPL
ncbi:MAG: hypothetical protein IPI91_17050 [Flavobacteriales bacterium]|nr:hypothetical protein [Flavobacteriales bacterium]MBK7298228.1 hypothetical protein [Flavobacteriales bacterium]HQW40728.1 hypothetical protein [Flavobacteriales bacterium]